MARRAVSGKVVGMLALGITAAMGCRFDTGGLGEGAPAADAVAIPPVDAPFHPIDGPPTSRPDARPQPDAPPAQPDAPPPLEPGTLRSPSAPGGLLVDGYLDDWATADWRSGPLSAYEHVDVYGDGYAVAGTARFASFHAGTSLYFAARVEEDVLVLTDSANLWDDDSVEIYLDLAGDAAGPWGPDDHWIVFVGTGECAAPDSGEWTPALSCRGRYSGTAYEIEARVDLAGLIAGSLGPGVVIGFGLGINDDDGLPNPGSTPDTDQDAYLGWYVSSRAPCSTCCSSYEHAEPWCDTTRLGYLELVP